MIAMFPLEAVLKQLAIQCVRSVCTPTVNSLFSEMVPYYRKLTCHEINANFKNSR